jgi:mono/diheme cytochrome c family protein
MKTSLVAFALLLFVHGSVAAQTGDAQAGKTLWEGPVTGCRNCHGAKGEGGVGPDLAGRKLTLAQFTRAVRKPWGVMPAFVESQMSDKDLADFLAYFESLPPVAQPGAWRFEVPAGAPRGQEIGLTVGCAQCHGPLFNVLRQGAGAVNGDFEWFKKSVYEHTTEQPRHFALLEQPQARLRMGNFSPVRVPESTLQEIWTFVRDLGFRPQLTAQLSAGAAAANGVTYTLNVANGGLPDKGLSAEELTVMLVVPAGSSVVSTTGPGYQGVRVDQDAKGNVAAWTVPRMAPKDRQTFTLTLSRAGTAEDNVRGLVRWTKPVVKTGPSDTINIAPAPIPGGTR